jgi:putative ABC transport system substrate-binding protein
MRRRDFIKGIAGTATAWPLAARAQQHAMPVIGFVGTSPEVFAIRLGVFREGLKETGFIEGQNVAIEYRWSHGQNGQLPKLTAELVQRQVAVIVAASGTPGAMAAKAVTTTIPVVFAVAIDPVKAGLVASLNRPGANLTGVTNLNVEVGPKRLELLHALLPVAKMFGILVDPTGPALSDPFVSAVQTAAGALGLQIQVLNAVIERDFDAAFSSLVQLQAGGLIIGPSTNYVGRTEQLAALTARHRIPAIYQYRPFAAAGGLLSYGSDEIEYYHAVGKYAGRILNGEKPAELPVEQSTKVELIINLKAARALGIDIPLTLLGRADEVIE